VFGTTELLEPVSIVYTFCNVIYSVVTGQYSYTIDGVIETKSPVMVNCYMYGYIEYRVDCRVGWAN